MSSKLELNWIGKDKQSNIEPRILIERLDNSYLLQSDSLIVNEQIFDNVLIHGDNLLALKAIENIYTNKIKCIYIDPPYNTGSAFEHYDDNVEHSTWLSLMRDRLILLRNLLNEKGTIWIQIDDEEQAYLKVLCDEVFGRKNFINMISVNMKNIAGASGGGEDKRLKKNCEYILCYAKDYDALPVFKGAYDYEEISEIVQRYRDEGISWKYTTALINPGDKTYVGSTVDGDGNEIKIYRRDNYVIKPISQIMRDENISEKNAYMKYAKVIFQTAMPQSSIRPRVMEKVNEIGIQSDLYSIEYTPKTGRNKGVLYEQFYKGETFRLFAWLKDVSEEINGVLYKKTLQGTYWNFIAGTKNLTKEGGVNFPNGKKPESLIERIFSMCTEEGDLVLDSFLGSGTTAAVAHKMHRRWIGIEMGEQAYTHCKPRLDKIINGEDAGGITESSGWTCGGGYKFYELAPTLINIDAFGQPVINKEYNSEMLAAAVAMHEGFKYDPDKDCYWKQAKNENNTYLYVTTNHVNDEVLNSIKAEMKEDEFLVLVCKSYDETLKRASKNITIKKIPQSLLKNCEFGVDDYSLNIVCPPEYEYEEEDE